MRANGPALKFAARRREYTEILYLQNDIRSASEMSETGKGCASLSVTKMHFHGCSMLVYGGLLLQG